MAGIWVVSTTSAPWIHMLSPDESRIQVFPAGAEPQPLMAARATHNGPPRTLQGRAHSESSDQNKSRHHQPATDNAPPPRLVNLKADKTEVVEQDRAEQFAGHDQRQQGRRAEAVRQQDRSDPVY